MMDFNIDYNIDIFKRLFQFDEKTLECIKEDLQKRESLRSQYNKLSRLSLSPWYIRIVSIVEQLMAWTMSRRFNTEGDDFVFVTCIDPVHRVKTLPLISNGLKYTKFFLPTVTRPIMVRSYYKYYKKNIGEKVYIGTFSQKDVSNYVKFVKKHACLINDVVCNSNDEKNILVDYIKRTILYHVYAKRVFANVDNRNLWLFEHDKFFFIPVINQFRNKDVMTTQLQHGTFFNPQRTSYFPLYSDKIICCSEREKSMYKSAGIKEKDIFVVGAPLQTINPKRSYTTKEKYDMLVVLTNTRPQELEIQKKVLAYLKDKCKSKSILLRFRPRSMAMDKKNLSGYTDGFIVSSGSSLQEDLCSARKVITFSLDSIYEILSNKKSFILFADSTNILDDSLDGIGYTIGDIDKGIHDLFNLENSRDQEKYVHVFGETDIHKMSANFDRAINALKQDSMILFQK